MLHAPTYLQVPACDMEAAMALVCQVVGCLNSHADNEGGYPPDLDGACLQMAPFPPCQQELTWIWIPVCLRKHKVGWMDGWMDGWIDGAPSGLRLLLVPMHVEGSSEASTRPA